MGLSVVLILLVLALVLAVGVLSQVLWAPGGLLRARSLTEVPREPDRVLMLKCPKCDPSESTYPYGVSLVRGYRPTMEDRFVVRHSLLGVKSSSVYGVFDGHGGTEAAQFCADHLSQFLAELLQSKAPRDALSAAFLQMDGRCTRILRGMFQHVGTTAVVALVHQGTVHVANTGDSRCVLVRRSGAVVALSDDHNFSNESELNRLEQLNAPITTMGIPRVKGLAMTRSIGDPQSRPFVIPDPDIRSHRVSPDDACVVLASDGLWDALQNEDVASHCVSALRQNTSLNDVAQQLVRLALSRGSSDNITCLLVDLRRANA